MTASNIAIVFGPNLIRPEIETLETALNCPIVNHVIQRLVEVSFHCTRFLICLVELISIHVGLVCG
jgi:hypothetical protein